VPDSAIDIHNLDRRLQRAEYSVKACNPISRRNANLISSFEEACTAQGLSKARIAKYIQTTRKLAEWLGKDFDKANRADIQKLVGWIERQDYSAWTKKDYRITLKRFYSWLRETGEEYPDEVKWIKTTMREKDILLPDEVVTEEEVKRIVDAADSPRDRAFIMTLYESGARIGEVGSMRIRDASFEERYARVMLKGKKGSRRIIVPASAPYLSAWTQGHPLRNDPNAPLWVNMGTVNRHQAMSYPALAKVLRVACVRAGIKKRVNPHKLRHSRATFMASKVTEANMNEIFGWRQGSRMPSIYVHLSGRDVDDALLGVYGLRKNAEEKPRLAPKVCPRCEVANAYDAKFCSRCGLALDVKVAQELDAFPAGMSREQVVAQNIELMAKVRELTETIAKLQKGYAKVSGQVTKVSSEVTRMSGELAELKGKGPSVSGELIKRPGKTS